MEPNSKRRRFRLSIARPLQPIDTINRVIAVMFRYKNPVTYRDISSACNMHPVTVSQALSAAHDTGLTELAGKKGLYVLSKDGEDYARYLTAGKAREAREILRRSLRRNPRWTEIIKFLTATRGQSRDPLDLVLEIERITGKHWASMTRYRLRDSLVSILESAEMVIKEGTKIIAVKEEQIEQEEETEEGAKDMFKKPAFIPAPSPFRPEDTFWMLRGDDFNFEIRRSPESLEFAKKQFADWVEYLEKNLGKEKPETRQSGGVPNQEQ